MISFISVISVFCIIDFVFASSFNESLTGGVSGIDVSTLTSSSTASCYVSSGYTFIIPRGYKSSGYVDTNVCGTLTNAQKAGIKHLDVYLFPCPTCSKSASTQMSELVNYLNDNCKSSWTGRVWIDVEGSQYWLGDYSKNKQFYQGLVDSCHTLSVTCGIYASSSQWSSIFGSTSYVYGNYLPLWYPHYDNNPSFSDFSSFGGWTTPYAKQYYNTNTVCDQGVDKNWAPAWSDTNDAVTATCSHIGYYCGNDGLSLDSNTLYYCSGANASPVVSAQCAFTCVTMPSGQDDVCSTSGTCSTVSTGYYCGADKVQGDKNTLYLCRSSAPEGAQYCADGCIVAPSGQDDYCA
jgi:hypothetical protein